MADAHAAVRHLDLDVISRLRPGSERSDVNFRSAVAILSTPPCGMASRALIARLTMRSRVERDRRSRPAAAPSARSRSI